MGGGGKRKGKGEEGDEEGGEGKTLWICCPPVKFPSYATGCSCRSLR